MCRRSAGPDAPEQVDFTRGPQKSPGESLSQAAGGLLGLGVCSTEAAAWEDRAAGLALRRLHSEAGTGRHKRATCCVEATEQAPSALQSVLHSSINHPDAALGASVGAEPTSLHIADRGETDTRTGGIRGWHCPCGELQGCGATPRAAQVHREELLCGSPRAGSREHLGAAVSELALKGACAHTCCVSRGLGARGAVRGPSAPGGNRRDSRRGQCIKIVISK